MDPMFKKLIRSTSAFIAVVFSVNMILAPVSYAQVAFLPVAGSMVTMTPKFDPMLVKGIKLYQDNPFKFDFIVDKGQENLNEAQIRQEGQKMVSYFLAALTTPEKDMWVNLSPYEKSRVIPAGFGDTEMGKEMLAQDYMLKQIMATALYPEQQMGKEFWAKVYAQAQEKLGTTNVPINTFNKVWIVPSEAVVYENAQMNTVFVVKSSLKVMMEEDYLAANKNKAMEQFGMSQVPAADATGASAISAKMIKQIIIPALEKEVNEGANFSTLRQVYQSLILAAWYKKNLKDNVLAKGYVNQGKTLGVDTQDKEINQKIYQQYLKAYKKGAYSYVKEEVDPKTNKMIPRKYFSGGIDNRAMLTVLETASPEQVTTFDQAMSSRVISGALIALGALAIFATSSTGAQAASFGDLMKAVNTGGMTFDGKTVVTGNTTPTGINFNYVSSHLGPNHTITFDGVTYTTKGTEANLGAALDAIASSKGKTLTQLLSGPAVQPIQAPARIQAAPRLAPEPVVAPPTVREISPVQATAVGSVAFSDVSVNLGANQVRVGSATYNALNSSASFGWVVKQLEQAHPSIMTDYPKLKTAYNDTMADFKKAPDFLNILASIVAGQETKAAGSIPPPEAVARPVPGLAVAVPSAQVPGVPPALTEASNLPKISLEILFTGAGVPNNLRAIQEKADQLLGEIKAEIAKGGNLNIQSLEQKRAQLERARADFWKAFGPIAQRELNRKIAEFISHARTLSGNPRASSGELSAAIRQIHGLQNPLSRQVTITPAQKQDLERAGQILQVAFQTRKAAEAADIERANNAESARVAKIRAEEARRNPPAQVAPAPAVVFNLPAGFTVNARGEIIAPPSVVDSMPGAITRSLGFSASSYPQLEALFKLYGDMRTNYRGDLTRPEWEDATMNNARSFALKELAAKVALTGVLPRKLHFKFPIVVGLNEGSPWGTGEMSLGVNATTIASKAMTTDYGGIDFEKVNVMIKNGGSGIKTAFSDPKVLEMLRKSPGLFPEIQTVTPMTAPMVNMLLGLNNMPANDNAPAAPAKSADSKGFLKAAWVDIRKSVVNV